MDRILSIDLAFRKASDLGICLLTEDGGRASQIEYLTPMQLGLAAHLEVEPLSEAIDSYSRSRDVRVVLLDGPQGWKGPDNGIEHMRLCERELHTPGKTGLPGHTKPSTYLGYIGFSIEVFDALVRRGWKLAADSEIALSDSDHLLLESFPSAAWQSLGLSSLPAKSKSTQETIDRWRKNLDRQIGLISPPNPSHDDLQALVAGLAGIGIVARQSSMYVAVGAPPFLLGGTWREGFIVNPTLTQTSQLFSHQSRGSMADPRAIVSRESHREAPGGTSGRHEVNCAMAPTVALHFRDQLREARAVALRDAEAFEDIVFAIERIGIYLTGKIENLGGYALKLENEASRSPLARDIPSKFPDLHAPFSTLYELVRNARNDALHEGAFARHLTNHAVELSIMLEDALMADASVARDFMVRDPVCAYLWQPISSIRRSMLANSFSFLPVDVGNSGDTKWMLLSDFAIADYLRSAKSANERNKRLARKLGDIQGEMKLTEAPVCLSEDSIEAVLGQSDGRPVLVMDQNRGLCGIVTPFDLL